MKPCILLIAILLCMMSSFDIASSSRDKRNKKPKKYKPHSSSDSHNNHHKTPKHKKKKKRYSASDSWSHKKKHTKLPSPEPTAKPTKAPSPEPTDKPTPSPIRDSCEITGNSKFDFIVMYDNTCGLSQTNCDEFLEGIGEIISRILNYPSTRVQTIEFQTLGTPEIIIDFDDTLLQHRPLEYIQTIRQNGVCSEGGKGETDLKNAVDFAIEQFDTNDDRFDKIIIVSTCMDKDVCYKDIITKLEKNNIGVHVVNLIRASRAKNVIKTKSAHKYLLCLTGDKDKICVGNCEKGVDIHEFDEIIEECLIKTVCKVDTLKPTPEPTEWPTPEPTEWPTPEPTEWPTPEPTEWPTPEPTEWPTPEPTEWPTPEPTEWPTPEPTEWPTPEPTEWPTPEPTEWPTPEPTEWPTPEPTEWPTPEPTEWPTPEPTEWPTPEPTEWPTPEPTEWPTPEPTEWPTPEPTEWPTPEPTEWPTPEPTEWPTPEPTEWPTPEPTEWPTPEPTEWPTPEPTEWPTPEPTEWPTPEPTEWPTPEPTRWPTPSPIQDICPYEIRQGEKFDFYIILDNTCALTQHDCDEYLEGIGEIISKLLDDTMSTRIETVEMRPHGNTFTLVAFENENLQTDPLQYVQFVRENGQCTADGNGQTDAAKALADAFHALNLNDDRIDKIIMVSACKDKKEHKICEKIAPKLFANGIDLYVVNLIKSSNAKNVIKSSDANVYLECATDNPICTGTNQPGVTIEEFDDIIDKCLLPGVCEPPTPAPTEWPTPEPTEWPTPEPTEWPTPEPTEWPTPEPTEWPTPEPTEWPTPEPTEWPTPEPTEWPTPEPTEWPTPEPTEWPTPEPTEWPTPEPTEWPTPEPTEWPTPEPTEWPTPEPTEWPTPEPTEWPTPEPTEWPTPEPTEWPTPEPTEWPTPEPTEWPTPEPTEWPTPEPTEWPTPEPTEWPTPEPTEWPTPEPTEWPTPEPTEWPTPEPTEWPTPEPTEWPTPEPTEWPTPEPTEWPTPEPTEWPTPEPTEWPTPEPTEWPTPEPTEWPTNHIEPTEWPTPEPTEWPTPEPTNSPTRKPTKKQHKWPTPKPTKPPSKKKRSKKKPKKQKTCHTQLESNKEKIDFVIFIDDSSGFGSDYCDKTLTAISKIIDTILYDPYSRVVTFAYGEGRVHTELLVNYDNTLLQKDSKKYGAYIEKHGECTNGGNGQSNLYQAMKRAIQSIDYKRQTKFVVISGGKDTTQKICKLSKEIDTCEIDTYFINLIPNEKNVKNMFKNINDANDYLKCFINDQKHRISVIYDDILDNDIIQLFPDICQPIHANTNNNKSKKGKRNKKKH